MTELERPETADYGPQTAQILALIERASRLGWTEAKTLHRARGWRGVYAAYAAERELRDGLRVAGWNAGADIAYPALAAVGHIAQRWDAVSIDGVGRLAADAAVTASGYPHCARPAADAAIGLAARHLIARYPYHQEHYDVLTRPWRTTIGPIHPDDAPASGTL
jgi:hypothetical protein